MHCLQHDKSFFNGEIKTHEISKYADDSTIYMTASLTDQCTNTL